MSDYIDPFSMCENCGFCRDDCCHHGGYHLFVDDSLNCYYCNIYIDDIPSDDKYYNNDAIVPS